MLSHHANNTLPLQNDDDGTEIPVLTLLQIPILMLLWFVPLMGTVPSYMKLVMIQMILNLLLKLYLIIIQLSCVFTLIVRNCIADKAFD